MNKMKYIGAAAFAAAVLALTGCGRTAEQTEIITEPTAVMETTTATPETEPSTTAETSALATETAPVIAETTIPTTEAEPETEPETPEPTTETATQETATSAVSFDDVRKAVENGDYSLVTPEFKETMDAYEAFYDEYIAFMKKYTSGEGDMMSMLTDYTTMLGRLSDWSQKIDAIDEETLSPADDAYFLLVTLRVEQKLLGTAYGMGN